jgi:hypothetical protein
MNEADMNKDRKLGTQRSTGEKGQKRNIFVNSGNEEFLRQAA